MSGGGGRSGNDQARAGGALPPAPAPSPADVGVVAALAVEVGFLTDKLSQARQYTGPRFTVHEGECAGKLVALTVVGMGREAARRGTRLLIDGHRPRWVVSAGFGGALNPELRRFAVVLPSEVMDREGH